MRKCDESDIPLCVCNVSWLETQAGVALNAFAVSKSVKRYREDKSLYLEGT